MYFMINQRRSASCLVALIILATEMMLSTVTNADGIVRDMTNTLSEGASNAEIVDHLLLLRSEAGVSRALAKYLPHLTRDKAYRIQMDLLAKMESKGDRLAGWKMGGTKIAKAGEKLDPVFGFMMESDNFQSGSSVAANRFASDKPIIEAEIAFWIGKDLPGPNITRKELISAIAGMGGASEIISARLQGSENGEPLPLNLAITDGLSHGGFILPSTHIPLDQTKLRSETGQVEINNMVIANGKASVYMNGIPLDAVLSLANQLPKYGRYLRSGEVVVIGSMLDSPPAQSGDHVEVKFSSFEPVKIDFQ